MTGASRSRRIDRLPHETHTTQAGTPIGCASVQQVRLTSESRPVVIPLSVASFVLSMRMATRLDPSLAGASSRFDPDEPRRQAPRVHRSVDADPGAWPADGSDRPDG